MSLSIRPRYPTDKVRRSFYRDIFSVITSLFRSFEQRNSTIDAHRWRFSLDCSLFSQTGRCIAVVSTGFAITWRKRRREGCDVTRYFTIGCQYRAYSRRRGRRPVCLLPFFRMSCATRATCVDGLARCVVIHSNKETIVARTSLLFERCQ